MRIVLCSSSVWPFVTRTGGELEENGRQQVRELRRSTCGVRSEPRRKERTACSRAADLIHLSLVN